MISEYLYSAKLSFCLYSRGFYAAAEALRGDDGHDECVGSLCHDGYSLSLAFLMTSSMVPCM